MQFMCQICIESVHSMNIVNSRKKNHPMESHGMQLGGTHGETILIVVPCDEYLHE